MWVISTLTFLGGLLLVNGILLYLSWRKALTPRRGAALWAGFWGIISFVGVVVGGGASTVSLAIGGAIALLMAAVIYLGTYYLVRYLLERGVRK